MTSDIESLINPALIKSLPLPFLKGNEIFPISADGGVLKAFYCNENGLFAIKELSKRMNLKPEPAITDRKNIIDLINKAYSLLGNPQDVMDTFEDTDFTSVATEFESPKDILELTEEAPIIRLLNALIQQAIKDRASDIHIEPYETELEVRFRIDGILTKVLTPPKIIKDALISRVKIMAGLDIAEKRLPQDGRIRLLSGGRDIDIRVSIVPTSHGERAVLRLLDRQQGLKGLWELGLSDTNCKILEDLIKRPNGIILVTGPTGSGKTTTLYALLNRIEKDIKNIITVEDPIEYQLKGVGQIQVNPRIGLTFASGLRSILRQDPDVIMVGEIRDLETAEIAIQASLTGHLVFSTLHTNDSASTITRLLDMNIEPFLIASSLTAVLAQRLVRTICPSCKQQYAPMIEEIRYFDEAPPLLYKGKGCNACKMTGYIGRTGIFELLLIDNELRRLITSHKDANTIKEYCVSVGMVTLFQDGLDKVRQGVTTLEEVLRVSLRDYVEV
ncbi:MAG: type II secretion system ATPase GspE [Thermodesulfovibrionales bacterium]|nr:type II secretion system ATPase GspE [Thermodesulfovibrionales bacterium]